MKTAFSVKFSSSQSLLGQSGQACCLKASIEVDDDVGIFNDQCCNLTVLRSKLNAIMIE